MQAAWYQYSYDQNFGAYPDPVGPYAKPDANFYGIPAGTPITALASGVVTSVRRQPWAPLAYSVTVRMDNAYNSVARYTAYNYVSSPIVSLGQHINSGDTLAFAGNPYNVGTAFALSDSPVYGTGTVNSPFSGTYINPALNPVPFLQAAIPGGGSGQVTGILNATNLNGATGGTSPGDNSFLGFDFTRFIDAFLLLVIGITLIVVGGLLLLNKLGVTQTVAKAAIAA